MLNNSAKKMNIKQLNSECLAFRNAILESDNEKLSQELASFPRGSCWWCCELLLHHFNKINFPNIQKFYYVKTGMGTDRTHAWLEVDRIIIDITISQFHKGLKKVIFDNDRWHKEFNDKSKIAYCSLATLEGNNRTNLISDYHEIMKNYKVL